MNSELLSTDREVQLTHTAQHTVLHQLWSLAQAFGVNREDQESSLKILQKGARDDWP
jgi:hypothetical protein